MQRRRCLVVHPPAQQVHARDSVGGDVQLPVRGGELFAGGEPVCPIRVQHVQQVPPEAAEHLRVVPFGLLEQERLPLRAGGRGQRRGQGLHRTDDGLCGVLADRPRGQRRPGGGELAGHCLPGHRHATVEGGGQAHLRPGLPGTQP